MRSNRSHFGGNGVCFHVPTIANISEEDRACVFDTKTHSGSGFGGVLLGMVRDTVRACREGGERLCLPLIGDI